MGLTDQQKRIKAMRAQLKKRGVEGGEASKYIAAALGITTNAVYRCESYVATNGKPGRKPRKALS